MIGLLQFLIRLDSSVFHSINSLAGKWSVSDWLARFGADDHIIPILLTLLALSILLMARNREERQQAITCVICVFVATVLAMAAMFVLKDSFFRPHPFTDRTVHLLFYHATDSSFPSTAAALAFAQAFAVLLYKRRLGLIMIALSLYLGFARIMVGIHYPLDIIAGMFLGLSTAFLAKAAEPLYRPLARWLTDLEYRLLASWKTPHARRHEGGVRP
jgi:undecaprenyl-diphosphatase